MNSKLHIRNEQLLAQLEIFLESETLNFSAIKSYKKAGVYAIIIDDIISYVGKTTRSGSTRMIELAADYRSHTLNRKLLKDYLEGKLSQSLNKFNKETKSTLIESGIISEDEFVESQRVVNTRIREDYKFQFLELELNDLTSFEHFAIGVLNPKFND